MKHLVVYAVRIRPGKTDHVPIGTGIENRDGSLNIYLDALPIDGKLVMRALPEKGVFGEPQWAGHERHMLEKKARGPAPQPPPRPTRTQQVVRGADGEVFAPFTIPEEGRLEAPPADAVPAPKPDPMCWSKGCEHPASQHKTDAMAICAVEGCPCAGFEVAF